MRPSSFLNVHNANTIYLIYMLPQLCTEDYTMFVLGVKDKKQKQKLFKQKRSNDIIL